MTLILNLSNNHHRKEGFFNKIENILLNLEKDIKDCAKLKQYYSYLIF